MLQRAFRQRAFVKDSRVEQNGGTANEAGTAALAARSTSASRKPSLVLLAADQKRNGAFALAEPLSRRGMERACETLVAWAREA
jgi:hypothetical protein